MPPAAPVQPAPPSNRAALRRQGGQPARSAEPNGHAPVPEQGGLPHPGPAAPQTIAQDHIGPVGHQMTGRTRLRRRRVLPHQSGLRRTPRLLRRPELPLAEHGGSHGHLSWQFPVSPHGPVPQKALCITFSFRALSMATRLMPRCWAIKVCTGSKGALPVRRAGVKSSASYMPYFPSAPSARRRRRLSAARRGESSSARKEAYGATTSSSSSPRFRPSRWTPWALYW